jgi:hypothetical protein
MNRVVSYVSCFIILTTVAHAQEEVAAKKCKGVICALHDETMKPAPNSGGTSSTYVGQDRDRKNPGVDLKKERVGR